MGGAQVRLGTHAVPHATIIVQYRLNLVHRATSIVHTSVQRTKPSIPCYCTSFFRRYGSSTTTSADASPQASLSPSLLQQLEGLTVRHATITKELEDPHISVASLTSLSKEAAELSPVVEALRVFKDVRAAMASANAVCDDPHEDAGGLYMYLEHA